MLAGLIGAPPPITPYYHFFSMITLLAAHILFDGWLSKGKDKYVVGYASKSSTLLSRVEKLLRAYGCKHVYRRTRKNGVTELECYSKDLFRKISAEIERIKTKKISLVEVIDVLRAFWDDEGTISIDKKRARLRARQKDRALLHTLLFYHKQVGIDAVLDYDGIGILISGKGKIREFSLLIGFSRGVRVGKSKSGKFYGKEKSAILNLYV